MGRKRVGAMGQGVGGEVVIDRAGIASAAKHSSEALRQKQPGPITVS